jgi:4-hydroxybenzoate polyprenyltransferase
MHAVTMMSFVALAWATPLPPFYYVGVAIVGALLAYEQSLVRADDLSQVKRAFDMNGYVGILYLFVLGVSVYAG